MKPNNQLLALLKEGFSITTLENLNEKQIEMLYNRLVEGKANVEEQTTTTSTTTAGKGITVVSSKNPNATNIAKNLNSQGVNVQMTEKKDIEKKQKSKKNMSLPIGKMSKNSGTFASMDEAGKAKNPWAICTAQLEDEFGTSKRSEWSKSQMKKYEKCVMDVKKTIKEGNNPYDTILENRIMNILGKHISPKISKHDFINMVSEADAPTIAPPKPTTAPKPTEKPFDPYNPNPVVTPKPMARGKKQLPSWLKWDKLGIKFKK